MTRDIRSPKRRPQAASLVLLLAVALLVWLIPQRAGSHPGAAATAQT